MQICVVVLLMVNEISDVHFIIYSIFYVCIFCANISIKVYFPKKAWTIQDFSVDCRLQLYYSSFKRSFIVYLSATAPNPNTSTFICENVLRTRFYIYTRQRQLVQKTTVLLNNCLLLFVSHIYFNRETVRLKTDLGENHTYQWAPACSP